MSVCSVKTLILCQAIFVHTQTLLDLPKCILMLDILYESCEAMVWFLHVPVMGRSGQAYICDVCGTFL